MEDARRVGATTEAARTDDSKVQQGGTRPEIIFENKLRRALPCTGHGLEVLSNRTAWPWISQKPTAPGEKFTYEFTVHQEGTFFYHGQRDAEIDGAARIFSFAHPKEESSPRVDHDYGLFCREMGSASGEHRTNTASMEFNWLTFNGVSAPLTTPLLRGSVAAYDLRIVNLGWTTIRFIARKPICDLPGRKADGRRSQRGIPRTQCWSEWRRRKVVEFRKRKHPGDWMIHCHLPHT